MSKKPSKAKKEAVTVPEEPFEIPLIRTDPRWQDSDYVDKRTLTKQQIEALEDPENPMAYANVYDPTQYESIIEDFGDGENYSSSTVSGIWGEFVPTFFQLEWFEHFNQRDEEGNFLKNLEGTCVIHRRAGKSTGVISTVVVPRLLMNPALGLHIFPSLTQARGAIWDGMGRVTRDMSRPSIPYLDLIPRKYRGKRNNHNMTVQIKAKGGTSTYRLGGARGSDGTANHWRSFNPELVIGDEFGEWQDNVIEEIFDPILGQNGGPLFKIGTAKGENQLFRSYMYDKENPSQFNRAWLLTVDDTYYNDGERIISDAFIKKKLAQGTDPELIQQEYYCNFKAVSAGAWYRYQMIRVEAEDRIRDVAYNPSYPVYTAWDIGGDGQRCIVFQAYDDFVRDIDFIAMDNVPIGVIMDAVLAKYPSVKMHFFPHDGKNKQDEIDKFQSRIQNLKKKKGISNIELVKRTNSLADGITVTQDFLERCLFDRTRCQMLLTHLRAYKRRYNRTTQQFIDEHVHDAACHSADAKRTQAAAFENGHVRIQNKFFNDRKRKSVLPKFCKFGVSI